MEDSFKVRADRTFGSLTTSSSSTLSSLWCLTDDEFKEEPPLPDSSPPSSAKALGWDIEKDLDLLQNDDDDVNDQEKSKPGSSRPKQKPDGFEDEEWEIQSSVGLDCTLDYEEEEDEFDRVAAGKVKAEDRLYMRDVSDYGIYIDSSNELPSSFGNIFKDPRANHTAAKLRIQEDAAAAKKMDSLQVIDKHSHLVDDRNLKSIMKRKDDEPDFKPLNGQSDFKSREKRVRFDPKCKDDNADCSTGIDNAVMETDSAEAPTFPLPPGYPSGIPDYMRNPSKYTRYTFDSSSEMDEESNRQAYLDFLDVLKRSKSEDIDDIPVDLPKSLTFVARRKSSDSIRDSDITKSKLNPDDASNESYRRRGILVGLASRNEDDSNTGAMEEDEPKTEPDKRNRALPFGRQYRTKPKLKMEMDMEMDESV